MLAIIIVLARIRIIAFKWKQKPLALFFSLTNHTKDYLKLDQVYFRKNILLKTNRTLVTEI